MAVGRRKPDTRAVGDTGLDRTRCCWPGSNYPHCLVVGERDDGDDHPIEYRAAATQPPTLSMVHALERLTEADRRARTRSSEFRGAVPGSKKSVGPHL
jgi:hypothetical protein